MEPLVCPNLECQERGGVTVNLEDPSEQGAFYCVHCDSSWSLAGLEADLKVWAFYLSWVKTHPVFQAQTEASSPGEIKVKPAPDPTNVFMPDRYLAPKPG